MSKFSEPEIRFLLGAHTVERAVGNAINVKHFLSPILNDPRDIGMPEHMFDRILEDRADRLGNKFAEFRAHQRGASAPGGYHLTKTKDDADSLAAQIESTKLF